MLCLHASWNFFDQNILLAHLSQRLIGELIVYPGIRHPFVAVCLSTFSNNISSEAMKLILTKFHIGMVKYDDVSFLSQLYKNSGCYGNLELPLTYNGKNENWHLLLCHCMYLTKVLQKCSLSSLLQNVSFLSKPLYLIAMATLMLNLRKK